MALDEPGPQTVFIQHGQGRVEPLDMSHLDQSLALLCQPQKPVRFIQSAGDGFFDKDVAAGFQCLGSYLEMAGSGYHHRYGLRRLQGLIQGGESRDLVLTAHSGQPLGVAVVDSNEVGFRQFPQLFNMEAAQVAHPDDRSFNSFACHRSEIITGHG